MGCKGLLLWLGQKLQNSSNLEQKWKIIFSIQAVLEDFSNTILISMKSTVSLPLVSTQMPFSDTDLIYWFQCNVMGETRDWKPQAWKVFSISSSAIFVFGNWKNTWVKLIRWWFRAPLDFFFSGWKLFVVMFSSQRLRVGLRFQTLDGAKGSHISKSNEKYSLYWQYWCSLVFL